MYVDSYILKEGGREGFEIIFKKYSRFVFNTANSVLQDAELARDVVQDIFCDVWSGKKKIKVEVTLGRQLWIMTRNKAIDIKRHRAYDVLREDFKGFNIEDHIHVDIIGDSELFERVNRLPLSYKAVFLLKYEFGKSAAEISASTGLTIQTVRNKIHEGLAILRKQLRYAR